MTDLVIPCENCGAATIGCIDYWIYDDGSYRPFRSAWLCTVCGWFRKAVGRERVVRVAAQAENS